MSENKRKLESEETTEPIKKQKTTISMYHFTYTYGPSKFSGKGGKITYDKFEEYSKKNNLKLIDDKFLTLDMFHPSVENGKDFKYMKHVGIGGFDAVYTKSGNCVSLQSSSIHNIYFNKDNNLVVLHRVPQEESINLDERSQFSYQSRIFVHKDYIDTYMNEYKDED